MWYSKKQRESEFKLQNEVDDLRVVYNDDFGLVKFESGQAELIMTTLEAHYLGQFLLNIRKSDGVWIEDR